MAYGRRYRRRYTRRNSRSLSNRSIYGKKSARSQANQIASLRNRVNSIARSCRPETKIHYLEFNKLFNNSATSNISWGNFYTIPKADMIGNYVKFKTIKLSGVLEYTDTFENNVSIDHQRTCTMRIVVYQMRNTYSTGTPLVSDILDVSTSGIGYELNAYKPFKAGTGQIVKILSNRVITLSNIQSIKRFNITINKGMLNQTYLMDTESDEGAVSSSYIYPRGTIAVAFISSGLHWDSSYTQQVNMNGFIKIAYTDN
uniref:Capsid protein n=1 Tax=Syrmaticus ellioti CRESS-DNA-virus sp. TaxID=2815058 RepID=A0A8A4XCE3_9VIRU|nr:MAG: capsid protein [Syrmaticus ellioti CRESS-DNA-virus sp.]